MDDENTGRTRRLIEEWLPIAEIGIESVRERTPMTPSPTEPAPCLVGTTATGGEPGGDSGQPAPGRRRPGASSCTCWAFMATRWRPRSVSRRRPVRVCGSGKRLRL